jgi:cyclopropane fatty-acyl-phospholipid synthase-like methyltransferase
MADREAAAGQSARVIQYYNATGADYKRFWTGPEDLAMHFGYYDASVRGHKASLLKMNAVLAGYARIAPTDRVLDAGCGYGGSAIWLARHVGCQVVGITLVPAQVREARHNAARYQVADKARFEQMDYVCTAFPDASFDVVWALESIIHTDQKLEVLREAYRLLGPTGRIVSAEYLLRDHPPLAEAELAALAPWLEGWALARMVSVSDFARLAREAGFARVTTHDLTEHVRPSINRLGKLRLPTLATAQIAAVLARGLCVLGLFSWDRLRNYEGGVGMAKALRAGQWKYIVMVADKAL